MLYPTNKGTFDILSWFLSYTSPWLPRQESQKHNSENGETELQSYKNLWVPKQDISIYWV